MKVRVKMKVTIELPENASVREILEEIIKETEYTGIVGFECCCCDDLLLTGCEYDGLNPNCKLGYKWSCSKCNRTETCTLYKEYQDCKNLPENERFCTQLERQ